MKKLLNCRIRSFIMKNTIYKIMIIKNGMNYLKSYLLTI